MGDRFRSRPRGRDSEDSGRRDRRIEMHEVICDKCGKKCEVPFKPTAGKPIYCNECFRDNKDSSRGSSNPKEFEQINNKLDKIMKSLKIE
jgi:CxxC-x17-CxxC domain-containing protein